MILSDETLRTMMAEGSIVVEPIEPYQLQPASIDLRLGRHFLKIDENTLESLSLDGELPYIQIEKNEIVIPRIPSCSPPRLSSSGFRPMSRRSWKAGARSEEWASLSRMQDGSIRASRATSPLSSSMPTGFPFV